MAVSAQAGDKDIKLTLVGTYRSGLFAQGGAEISAYDAKSRRLFVVNGAAGSLTVLDLSNPAAPAKVTDITFGGAANSVDIHDGLVAVAVEAAQRERFGFRGSGISLVPIKQLQSLFRKATDTGKVSKGHEFCDEIRALADQFEGFFLAG